MQWLQKQVIRINYVVFLIKSEVQLKWRFIQNFFTKDKYILVDRSRKTRKDSVNIHYWRNANGEENLGDYLSNVICDYLISYWNLPHELPSTRYRHLYAVGSIIGFSYQNAVVWGSGLLEPCKQYLQVAQKARLDIRCVRGPKTRDALLSVGIKCPEKYGDPAILMPLIYRPKNCNKKYRVSVIRHYLDQKGVSEDANNPLVHSINILTTDYKGVIDEIVQSKRIISSSLHGIILSEAYGVPAILLSQRNLFKYEDYYYSTGRYNIRVAETIQEGMKCDTMPLPNLREMQKSLINLFPRDLWR